VLITQVGLGEEEVAVVPQPNTMLNVDIVKPLTFSGKAG